MFNSLMMLAVEANGVVALRMMKLMLGGKRARREVELMVSSGPACRHRNRRRRLLFGSRGTLDHFALGLGRKTGRAFYLLPVIAVAIN